MSTHAEKNQENPINIGALRSESLNKGMFSPSVDQRPQAAIQAQLQMMANNSSRVQQLKAMQTLADQAIQRKLAVQLMGGLEEEDMLQGKFEPLQRMGGLEEEDLLQGKFMPLQRMGGLEEEDLLQGKFGPIQRKENHTGLPDQLKSGIENLSGYSMDDVQVHYNSPQPKQLHAHAYAQGSAIHLAPGQERHLPHEAWHVVQQKQGRVQATLQAKGIGINDDPGLEHEADVMGTKALQQKEEKR